MASKQINQIKELIALGKIDKAIVGLRTVLEDSDQEYEAILQSSRFSELAKEIRNGKVSFDEAHISKNQIISNILGIIEEIEKEDLKLVTLKSGLKLEDENYVKLSDKLADPLIRVYQAGGLALVFIFIGLILVFTAQFNQEGIYSAWIFGIGATLILISFLIFLYIQLKNPLTSKKNIRQGKEVVDELQKLSIDLVRLTGRIQALSFKHLNEINDVMEKALPVIHNLPFIGEGIKKKGIELQNISNSIVEYSNAVEETIQDVEKALVSSDVKKFKGYADKVRGFSARINQILMK